MKKVIIKTNKKTKVPQGVLDVIDNSKPTPTEDLIKLVKGGSFSKAFLRDEQGNIISAISFSVDNRLFIGVTPNPIDIYFGIAFTFLNHSRQIFEAIKMHKEDINLPCVLLIDNKFNSYLQYCISTIILLHSTLEAFINSIIPDDNYTYSTEVREKGQKITKKLAKEEIERLNFSEKFKAVVKDVTKIDFAKTNPKLYRSLIDLNTLRCDLIHLKTIKDGRKENYVLVFIEVINSDLDKYAKDVKEYINLIRPDTIQFTKS